MAIEGTFVPHSCGHCQKIVVTKHNDWQRLPYTQLKAHLAAKDGCKLCAHLTKLYSLYKPFHYIRREKQEFIEKLVLQIEDDVRQGVLRFVSDLRRPYSILRYAYSRLGRISFRIGWQDSGQFNITADPGNLRKAHN